MCVCVCVCVLCVKSHMKYILVLHLYQFSFNDCSLSVGNSEHQRIDEVYALTEYIVSYDTQSLEAIDNLHCLIVLYKHHNECLS